MKIVKTSILILSILLIGFVAGFQVHRYMTVQKVRTVAEMRQARGFQEHLLNRLDVTDEQRAQMAPVIEDYADKMAVTGREHRKEMRAVVDSLHAELKPFLTTAQQDQLKKFKRRFRGPEMGPPPPRPHRNRPARDHQ